MWFDKCLGIVLDYRIGRIPSVYMMQGRRGFMETALRRADRLTILLIGLMAAGAAIAFWPILDAVILALSLAVVTIPLHNWISRRIPDWISASVVTLFIAVLIFGAAAYIIYVVYSNAGLLQEMINTVLMWGEGFRDQHQLAEQLFADNGNEPLDYFIALFRKSVNSLPIFVIKVVLFFLSLYMCYLAGEKAWRRISEVLPGHLVAATKPMIAKSVDTMYAVWVAHIATAVITFFLALPFFYILGYGNIFFFATITALFQLIPIIGQTLVVIFFGLYALALGDYTGLALLLFIGYPVVFVFPDLVLRPLMMGQRTAIHPVLMWIGFFGGMAAMGLVGFVLGPLFIALGVSGYHVLVAELKDPESFLGSRIPGKPEE